MNKIVILYICTDYDQFAGSSLSLLNLINSVKSQVYPIVLLPAEGIVSSTLREQGVECIVCPFYYLWEKKRNIKTLIKQPKQARIYRYLSSDIHCAKYVQVLLKKKQVSIVHSNSTISTVGVLISKVLHAKHVWHVREMLDIHFDIKIFLGKRRLIRLINHADTRICISNSIFKHWDIISKNTDIIPDAVRSISDICYYKNKEPYFLACAAQINDNKKIDVAVKAFCKSDVAKHGYKLKLLGYCSEEFKQKLMNIAQSYNMEKYIEFEGYQLDVSKYFKHAYAFIMCSPYEGLGRVTIEAMCYGCVVIGVNSSATAEIISNNINGWLYNNEYECAQLIKQSIEKNTEDMILCAQQKVKDMYTEEVYGKKILSLYHSLLK